MKRKSSEKHDFSDDEAYPPLKVRSTVEVDIIVSSDDEHVEQGESSAFQQTVAAAGEDIPCDMFSDLDSTAGEVINIQQFLSTEQSSGGECESPNRL